MERFRNTSRDIPLCKFGPGGDYTSEWKAAASSGSSNTESPLGHVLNAIAEIIGATVQPEILTEIACALPPEPQSTTPPTNIKENQESHEDGEQHTDHTKTIPHTVPSGKLSKEPLLFGNDWGIGTGLKYQPGHRVRTHRRASRKRTADSLHGQGTLFEVNKPGRKTA